MLDDGIDTPTFALGKEDMQVELDQSETIQLNGVDGEDQPRESEEDLRKKYEMWEVFQEEQHESMYVRMTRLHGCAYLSLVL